MLHPLTGLVGFSSDDALTVADLLAVQPFARQVWDRADPGLAPPRPLRSVTAELPPDVGTIFEKARGDIGSRPLDEVPPPDVGEPYSGPLGKVAQFGTAGLAGAIGGLGKVLGWVGNSFGAKASEGGFSLSDWLMGMAARLDARLQSARNREIDRLLRLLVKDPDQGLRYALPLAGSGHRGQAPPSSRLGPRDVNFSLGGVRGGGPADVWDVPWEYQRSLHQRYRELAERELALGRFRRAAYVYAQLLGDYHSAANVLVQGRHFREAAVLFKDHLHNTNQAAMCLEQGGLLPEAIALYLDLEEHEKVGDLFAIMDDREAATVAWRRAVESHLASAAYIDAAGLLEQKLEDVEGALEALATGWVESKQPERCLEARFDLLARLERHDEAIRSVESLRDSPASTARRVMAINVLGSTSLSYPYAPLRELAADSARVVASQALESAETKSMRQIVQGVAALRPKDRLLRRDTSRFATRPPRQTPLPPRRMRQPGSQQLVTWVRTLDLSKHGIDFEAFASGYGLLLGVGTSRTDDRPALLGVDWESISEIVKWDSVPHGRLPMFVVPPRNSGGIVLGAPDMAALLPQKLSIGPAQYLAFTPSWLPAALLAVTWDERGQLWSASESSPRRLLISCYSARAALLGCDELEIGPGAAYAGIEQPVKMVAVGDEIWLAIGPDLVRYRRGEGFTSTGYDRPIISLSATMPRTVPRVAITLDEEGVIVWTGRAHSGVSRFAHEMDRPIANFINDGHLIAAAAGDGRVYVSGDGQVAQVAKFEAPPDRPIGIVQANDVGKFAVLTKSAAHIYQIRRNG